MQGSFPLKAWDYLQATPSEDIVWVVQDVLCEGGLLTIYGGPKAGKSYLGLALACAIANGSPDWLGFPIKKSGPVLYISLDTPPTLWRGSFMKHAKEAGLISEQTPLFIGDQTYAPFPFDLLDLQTGAFGWVQEVVKSLQPTTIFVDVVRKLHSGDEDKSGVMMACLNILEKASPGVAKVILGHEKKPPQEGENPLMAGLRGSNYPVGQADTIMKITKYSRGTRATLWYDGRELAEGKLKLMRKSNVPGPDSFWQIDTSEEARHLAAVLQEGKDKGLSQRAMAKELADRSGLSFDAAHGRIKRALD